MRAAAFAVQDDAFAELAVAYALAEAHAARKRRLGGAAVDRARHDHRGPHLFDELGGDLAQEPRWDREAFLAVQPPLLGVREVQLALGARDTDVAEAPLFLEAGRIVQRALVREQ